MTGAGHFWRGAKSGAVMKLPGIFRAPIHAALKRWGNSNIRKRIWDKEFSEGRWLHSAYEERPDICDLIDKYLPSRWTLLDLGCSDGLIGRTQNGLGKYIGVDVSKVAIEAARNYEQINECEWVCSDISKFVPNCLADVILFRYSLYYLNIYQVEATLKKYHKYLSANGVFMVVMDNPERHRWVGDIIIQNFNVVEHIDGNPLILVFR
jgi:trans-aconitate methyltransferase